MEIYFSQSVYSPIKKIKTYVTLHSDLKFKLGLRLLGVKEVRWDKHYTEKPGDCAFFCGNGISVHRLVKDFFDHTKRLSYQQRG
jgi:hypothetical protein